MQLQNYASGPWIAGSGKQAELIDAITGDLIGTRQRRIDFARTFCGPPPAVAGRRRLLQMTFPGQGSEG